MTTNNIKKYGFRWVRGLYGGPMQVQRARLSSGLSDTVNSIAVDFRPGDPIHLLSTGYVIHQVGSEGTQASNLGIVVGVGPSYDGSAMQFNPKVPAGTTYGSNYDREQFVYYVPGVGNVFEIDCDDNSTATTYAAYLAFVGENADHVLTTGSQPASDPMLDISTHNTTNTLLWRIVDVSQDVANQDFAGTQVKLLVTANVVQQAAYATTGI